MNNHSQTGKRPPHRGFALPSVIMIMSLVMVVLLGMLSLSQIETRNINADKETARANARLALMLAIGSLQKEMGPDQRISASAAILDTSPESASLEGIAQPRYVGIWDAWDTWLNDAKTLPDGSTIRIGDTYDTAQRGRHPKLFRRWLVSGSDQQTSDMDFASTGPSTGMRKVTLVGKYDVGTSNHGVVEVPVVPVNDISPTRGGYAWWVGDQSQKARVDLDDRKPASGIQQPQISSSSLGRPPIENTPQFENIDPTTRHKWLDISTLYLASAVAPDPSQELPFHAFTTSSLGLMTDVRFGGMKQDLNTAFELSSVPSEFGRTNLFGVEFDHPVRPMTGDISLISPANPYVAPLSWRQMHQYYRLYREFTDNSRGRYLQWSAGKPNSRQFMMANYDASKNRRNVINPDTDGYARKLVLLRQYWVVCLRTEVNDGDREHYITAVPVFYYWNPYNVPITVDANELHATTGLIFATNLKCTVYEDSVRRGSFSITNQMNATNSGGVWQRNWGKPSVNVTYQPGEVRVFSTNTLVGGQVFTADPGYIPVVDNSAARGLQLKIPYSIAPGKSASMALSFTTDYASGHRHTAAYFSGNDATGISIQHALQANQRFGTMDENGDPLRGGGNKVAHNTSIAWLGTGTNGMPDERETSIIRDSATERAHWPVADGLRAVAVLGLTAKDPDGLIYSGANTGYAADYRARTWLHASPARLSSYLVNPQDISRASSPWQMYFTPATANSVSNYLQTDGHNAFYGNSFGATGSKFVVAQELPTSPITNLAGFAGMRMDAARAHDLQSDTGIPTSPNGDIAVNYKHAAHNGADFGPAIGNAYASPLIPGDQVYHRISLGTDLGYTPINHHEAANFGVFDDCWDHLFLTNEALWDSYFMSSIVPESTSGSIEHPIDTVARKFFNNTAALPNANYVPLKQGKTAEELAGLTSKPNGWKSIGAYIGVKGAFNVNCTSADAWKAFLQTMRNREIPYYRASDGATGLVSSPDHVVVSRFRLANNNRDGKEPADSAAWNGIRLLDDAQIDRLATEIVKQVRLRGPFLNMTEFINRRLSEDRLGITGAIQAAIDWDEFENNYNGTGSNDIESINRGYKQGSDMVASPSASFPNMMASRGSRFAGAPGYVMQSDLLQGIGSSITVRGDTYRIRAYGEARNATGTKVTARAWCEAIVQRMPGYIDSTNPPETPNKSTDGTDNPVLTDLNRTFGRKMNVVSFRWLSRSEIETR